jgi:hypothetical protein
MKNVKELAPQKWPMHDIENLFKYNALKAASHRSADLANQKKAKKRDHELSFNYDEQPKREDWINFHKFSAELDKALGPEAKELFHHFEGMTIEAAWGAANERAHGRHANDAQVHWMKYSYHSKEAEALYKGASKWSDIHQMITEAAWGAANERTFGASSNEAKNSWKHFEEAASRVIAGHGGEL